MKTHILNYDPDRRGGGWTQARYLYNGLNGTNYDEADAVLITGPTMAAHEQVEQAKKDGKKIILRIDNAVRDSRNRGTGMSRMKAFADKADLIIYQSKWARDFLYPYLKIDGAVILNGVDTNKFNANGRTARDDSYLYIRSSRDEGKNWISAWYWFVNNPGHLDIVGKFSPDNVQWNFDFYNNESITFYGEVTDTAHFYKNNKYFLYSFICEAGSNTLLEARASGCEIVDVFGALQTGCGPEYMALEDLSIERMIKEYKEVINAIT